MKKLAKTLLALSLALAPSLLIAPGQSQAQEEQELIIFAAASMTETLEEIQPLFEEANPGVKLTFNFDSSGTLQDQIEAGAPSDVFISAAQKQMNELEEADLIQADSRVDLLENKVVLAVAEGNPAGIDSFDDLTSDKVQTLALGNEDVPVGQYSQELLTNLGIFEVIQEKVTYGSNVKEVTTWVDEGVAECGIIYQTDAKAAGLEVVDQAGNDLIQTPVIYPAAAVKSSQNPDLAQAFIDFLQEDPALEIFEAAGFTGVK